LFFVSQRATTNSTVAKDSTSQVLLNYLSSKEEAAMMPHPSMDPKLYYDSRTETAGYPKPTARHPVPLRNPDSLYDFALSVAATRGGFPAVAAVGGGENLFAPRPVVPSLVGEGLPSAPMCNDHYKGLGMQEILEIADDFLWADEDPLMTAKVHDISANSGPRAPTSAALVTPLKTPTASRASSPCPIPFCTPEHNKTSPPVVRREVAVRSVTAICVPSSSSKSVHPPLVCQGLSPSIVSLDSPTPSVVTLHSPSRQSMKKRRRAHHGAVVEEYSSSIASMSSEDEADDDDDDDDDDNDADEFAGDDGDRGGDGLGDSAHGSDSSQASNECRVRPYQACQWTVKFHELCQYRQRHGNCLVPHNYKPNMLLARWVKRQRYQYKLFKEGKASTMTEDRAAALNAVGFVWDSQETAWEERLMELTEFRGAQGHCNVPCTYRINPPLAAWVKCQRRQYKLYRNGKPSNITAPRIQQLENLGFEWEPRANKRLRVAQTRNARRKTK
jgi:Helicase associated domain